MKFPFNFPAVSNGGVGVSLQSFPLQLGQRAKQKDCPELEVLGGNGDQKVIKILHVSMLNSHNCKAIPRSSGKDSRKVVIC